MGREVRKVAVGWEHPKDHRGQYKPLYGGSYSARAQKWVEGFRLWDKGEHPAQKGEPLEDCRYFWEYEGLPPDPDDYMPDWPESERTHFMMYEDVSEGTPISPAFATPEELARWLSDTGANAGCGETAIYEQWLRVCLGGYAPSLVVTRGAGHMKIETGVTYTPSSHGPGLSD